MNNFINCDQEILKKPMVFIIACPMNAFMSSILGNYSNKVSLIYAFDSKRKDIKKYKKTFKDLMSNLKIVEEFDIEYDAQKFWAGKKNQLLPPIRKMLKKCFKDKKMTDWLIFGNCLTNPVGLAAKTFGNLNHLYHSPGDFFDLLFPKENKIKSWIKNCIKNFLKLEIYKIEKTKLPIYSLLKFKSTNFFHFIDYRAYNCDLVKNKLNKLRKSIRKQENNILLLVAGEEPEAGDKNFYNIKKYIKPHLLALAELKLKKKLSNSVVWVKEHKSYFPLSNYERNLLKKSFKTLNFKTKFVSAACFTRRANGPILATRHKLCQD